MDTLKIAKALHLMYTSGIKLVLTQSSKINPFVNEHTLHETINNNFEDLNEGMRRYYTALAHNVIITLSNNYKSTVDIGDYCTVSSNEHISKHSTLVNKLPNAVYQCVGHNEAHVVVKVVTGNLAEKLVGNGKVYVLPRKDYTVHWLSNYNDHLENEADC